MPMKNPKVSVILPTFNRAAYLPDAIESVLCQTFRDFELVIVDDGSTDNTRQIVQMYPDKRIRYRFKQNGGIASALNCGIKQSTGTYLARLDSDDVFLPEKLAYQVACLDANPDCGLVYTQAYNMDEKGNVLALYLKDNMLP